MEVETCAIKTPQGAQLNPPRCFSSSCPSRAATLSPPRTHHVPARPDPGASRAARKAFLVDAPADASKKDRQGHLRETENFGARSARRGNPVARGNA